MTHPSWLNDDRRYLLAITTDKPHSACRCQWEKTGKPFGSDEYWSLAQRRKDCPLHGARGQH